LLRSVVVEFGLDGAAQRPGAVLRLAAAVGRRRSLEESLRSRPLGTRCAATGEKEAGDSVTVHLEERLSD